MAEFDREELKAAFEAGKIAVADDNIRRLDGLLRAFAPKYRARKVARQQDLKRRLARLEETQSFLAGLWDTEALLCAFEVETPQIIVGCRGRPGTGLISSKMKKNNERCAGMIPRRHFSWVCAMSMSA